MSVRFNPLKLSTYRLQFINKLTLLVIKYKEISEEIRLFGFDAHRKQMIFIILPIKLKKLETDTNIIIEVLNECGYNEFVTELNNYRLKCETEIEIIKELGEKYPCGQLELHCDYIKRLLETKLTTQH